MSLIETPPCHTHEHYKSTCGSSDTDDRIANMSGLDKLLHQHYVPVTCAGDSVVASVPSVRIIKIRSIPELHDLFKVWPMITKRVADTCVWYAKMYKKIALISIRNGRLSTIVFVNVVDYKNWWCKPVVCSTSKFIASYDNCEASQKELKHIQCWMNKMVADSNYYNCTKFKMNQELADYSSWYANGSIIRLDSDKSALSLSTLKGHTYFENVTYHQHCNNESISERCNAIGNSVPNNYTIENRPNNKRIKLHQSQDHHQQTSTDDTVDDHVDTEIIVWLVRIMQELTLARDIIETDFIFNYRDHPLNKTNSVYAYDDYLIPRHEDDNDTVGNAVKEGMVNVFSVCGGTGFQDIAMPNQDDMNRLANNASGCQTLRTVPWRTKIPKAVFRGSSTGSGVTGDSCSPHVNRRMQCARMSVSHGDILDAGITKWNLRPRISIADDDGVSGKHSVIMFPDPRSEPPLKPSLTYDEQSLYKYVVHIDGHVAAFRLSAELFMESVILKVASPWNLWFSSELQPMVHYIPIKHDLSDLLSTIEWCIDNDDVCANIAMNAKRFAVTRLCRTSLLNYMSDKINDYTKEAVITERPVESQPSTPRVVGCNYQLHELMKRNESKLTAYKRLRSLVGRRDDTAVRHELTSVARYIYPGRYCCSTNESMSALVVNLNYKYSPLIEDKPLGVQVKSLTEESDSDVGDVVAVASAGVRYVLKRYRWSSVFWRGVECAYIGTAHINVLARTIPTFVYTMCAMVRHCDNSSFLLEVYTEYLKNAQSLKRVVHLLSPQELVSIATQVYVALHVASDRCRYVHGNLGDLSNVLIVKLAHNYVYRVYTRTFGAIQVTTNCVATIVNHIATKRVPSAQANVYSVNHDWNCFVESIAAMRKFDSRAKSKFLIEIKGCVTDFVKCIRNEVAHNSIDMLPASFMFNEFTIDQALCCYIKQIHQSGVPWCCVTWSRRDTVPKPNQLLECCEFFIRTSRAISLVMGILNDSTVPNNSSTCSYYGQHNAIVRKNTAFMLDTLLTLYRRYESDLNNTAVGDRINVKTMSAEDFGKIAHCIGAPPLRLTTSNDAK